MKNILSSRLKRIGPVPVAGLILSMFSSVLLQAADADRMRIVYDNIPGNPESELIAAGGFCAWIEYRGKTILFDTGGDGEILAKNLQSLHLDAKKLDAIFISHDHWDHLSGLAKALELNGDTPPVYVCPAAKAQIMENNPGARVIAVEKADQLFPQIWSSGPQDAVYKGLAVQEQFMIIEGKEGIRVILGCSHPGVVEMVGQAAKMFPGKPIEFVAGGFHLSLSPPEAIREISGKLKDLGVQRLAPTHCTGPAAIELFQKEWQEKFVKLHLGDEFRVQLSPDRQDPPRR